MLHRRIAAGRISTKGVAVLAENTMRKTTVVAVLAFVLTAVPSIRAQSLPSVDSLLSQSESTAAQQHKLVFIIFHASWCGPCHAFDRYLDSAEVWPIVDRYFVLVRVSAMEEAANHPERNNPGGNDLLQKLGGGDGVPFFAFLDADGRLIVNSIAPKTGNVGYPVEQGEIDWYMKMLARAVPSMAPAETSILQKKLRG
jgi:hypothetical protein